MPRFPCSQPQDPGQTQLSPLLDRRTGAEIQEPTSHVTRGSVESQPSVTSNRSIFDGQQSVTSSRTFPENQQSVTSNRSRYEVQQSVTSNRPLLESQMSHVSGSGSAGGASGDRHNSFSRGRLDSASSECRSKFGRSSPSCDFRDNNVDDVYTKVVRRPSRDPIVVAMKTLGMDTEESLFIE